eukprot:10009160-Alexandrium_andersonii.AAC.1
MDPKAKWNPGKSKGKGKGKDRAAATARQLMSKLLRAFPVQFRAVSSSGEQPQVPPVASRWF